MTAFKTMGVAVVCIWAEDVPTTVHFYRHVLQLELRGEHTAYPALAINEHSTLVILKGEPIAAKNSVPAEFPLFALEIDDVDQAVEQLKSHQVEIPRGIETHGTNRWVIFHDPAGNLIELVAHQP